MFGNFVRLQNLDLSNNFIEYLQPDTFRGSKRIQVLNLAQNELTEIHHDTFRTLGDLRIVDLSFNLLRNIPDSLFVSDVLERLDISNNQLTRLPVNSMKNLAAFSLCELDLSHNLIGATIHSRDLSNNLRVSSALLIMHALYINRWNSFNHVIFTAIVEARLVSQSDSEA